MERDDVVADNNAFTSGFAAITGRPNAGKSTLINNLIGEKIAITSSKPQTTRNTILAVYSEENCQIVFVDTPGIHKPRNRLGQHMEKSIRNATTDVNVLIYVLDCTVYENELASEKEALYAVVKPQIPVVLVLNKIDKTDKQNLLPLIDKIKDMYNFADIIPISAQKGDNVDVLIKEIKKHLVTGPKYFPDGVITDQPEKQIVSEIIREKSLRLLNQEIPHGIAVEIEKMEYNKKKEIYEINAAIYCEKQSHKGIVIGKGGEKLKKIGQSARLDIEKFLGGKVFLELWVRVKEDWRNKENFINDIVFD